MTVMTEPTAESILNVPDEFELLGRTFSPAKDMTLDRDIYIMSIMRAAKITDLFDRKNGATADLDDLSEAIIVAAFESGKMFEMTAAVLDEKGVKWTKAGSLKTAEWLSQITERKSKDMLMDFIAIIVLAFFMKGRGFSQTLSESLTLAANQSGSAASTISEAPRNEPSHDEGAESPEELSTSATGANLSDTLLHTIPTDTNPSSDGP